MSFKVNMGANVPEPSVGCYATHVFHYRHVVEALTDVFNEVRLLKRFEFSHGYIKMATKLRLPQTFLRLLNRRASSMSGLNASSHPLGVGQFLPALCVRMGIPIPFSLLRLISAESAFWVARGARGSNLLHFTDALGYQAIRNNAARRFIVEKRSPHHSVYDKLPQPVGDFPAARRIRRVHDDIYDIESTGSHAMIVYSSVVKQSYVREGYNPDRIFVVPLPVGRQLDRVVRQRNPNSFCFVGRGDVLKGLDVAVEAVKAVNPHARLQVAGPMSREVLTWLRSKSWVDYMGILDREELRELYSTCAALVLPSTESFSLVAVEANFHGLQVVCSDQTGAAEYLPAHSVTVVPGRSVTAWADALRAIGPKFVNDSHPGICPVSTCLSDGKVREALSNVYRKVLLSEGPPGLLM